MNTQSEDDFLSYEQLKEIFECGNSRSLRRKLEENNVQWLETGGSRGRIKALKAQVYKTEKTPNEGGLISRFSLPVAAAGSTKRSRE